jgi:hypothetical protein
VPASRRVGRRRGVCRSKPQRWLWRQWLLFWGDVFGRRQELGCPLYVILNGELADDNYHPTTQLITRNPADQMKLALQVLEPVTARLATGTGCSSRAALRRTPGQARRWMRRWRPTWARRGRKGKGLHRGGSCGPSWAGCASTWRTIRRAGAGDGRGRRSSFAAGLAAMAFFEAAERGERPPHLLIRGHVHRPGDSYDAYPTRALVLPSWQLSTSYGYRIGGGTLPVGGAYVVCDGRGGFEVVKRFTEWPIATYWKEPRE